MNLEKNLKKLKDELNGITDKFEKPVSDILNWTKTHKKILVTGIILCFIYHYFFVEGEDGE